jgi:hypothetical protein
LEEDLTVEAAEHNGIFGVITWEITSRIIGTNSNGAVLRIRFSEELA